MSRGAVARRGGLHAPMALSALSMSAGAAFSWPGALGMGAGARGADVTKVVALALALALGAALWRRRRRAAAARLGAFPRAPFARAAPAPEGTLSIAVIGGGPAGSTFALCAEQWGLPATVYERAGALAADDSSYINFKDVGMRALGEVSPELEQALRHNPTNLSPMTPIMTAGGDVMVTINDPSAILLRRNELSNIISSHCKAPPQYGAEVVAVTKDEAGVVIHFADGTTARHSMALMCCGSRIRKVKTDLEVKPKFYKKWVLRRVKDAEIAASMPQHEQLFFGRGGKLIFTFPGEYLLIGSENPAGLSKEGLAKEFGEFTGPVGGDFDGDLGKLIASTDYHRERQYISWRSPPPKRWFEGRVVAVGDACHPMTPATGSGASMAVLDAIQLAHCLAAVRWWLPGELEPALAKYQAAREVQIRQLWRIDSLRNGMNDITNPVGVFIRDLIYGIVFKLTTTLAKRRSLR